MFELRPVVLLLMVSAFVASSVQAAVLVNMDSVNHRLVIVEDNVRHAVILEAQTGIEGICEAGCQIYINDDAQSFEVAGSDIIEIRAGEPYRIDPDPDAEPSPNEEALPSPTPIAGD